MPEVYVNAYDAHDALNRAVARRREFESHLDFYLLLYSALDTRLCIERTLFEYLLLIKNNELSTRLEKLYSATNLKKAILQEEPKFFRRLEFVRLFVPFLGYTEPVVSPDVDLLSQCYGKVNDYLHAPKRPFETWAKVEWWVILRDTLDQAIRHLQEIHSGHMGAIDLNPLGEELFAKFTSGEMSAEDLVHEFEKRQTTDSPPQVVILSPRKTTKRSSE